MLKRILSVLSYVGMALVFGALAVRILRPEWDQYAIYASWAGLVLVLLYTIGQWREIVAFFQRRNARYGALASASVLIVLGILIAVNYLSTRQNKRWDLTANRQYSLSEQTVKLLQGLEAPVKFLVFDQAENLERFRARLTEFEYQSDQVDVEYIDADRRPVQAKEYEIQTYGTIVVEYMGRRERVTTDAEQDLTNALIKVLNPQEKRVYFLAGHGEKDPNESNERTGYSSIADGLRRDNYQFEKLVLAQTNSIPENATVIVIAGPTTDLLEAEVELLRQYLSNNGKLLVMLDPPDLKQPRPMPRLTGILRDWGVNVTDSVVVDISGLTNVLTVPVAAPPYPNHVITDRFNLLTMFPMARAVTPAEGAPPERTAQSFVQTTPRAWAEVNLASLENPEGLQAETDKGDIAGPVSLAVAVATPGKQPTETPAAETKDGEEQRTPETRVAVFGDSDFVANAYLGIEGNGDLFMNTVNWLAQQESLIAIRPREASDRRLTMTANHITGMFWLSVVLIPAAVIGAGIFTWWRRR
jgi:ABC-type uncharacterized transport system involved in gliding motility auxiliary subunit